MKQKWKYEEEDVGSYWMTLRKRDGAARRKRKHQIARHVEHAL
jgi:hypothetical protein